MGLTSRVLSLSHRRPITFLMNLFPLNFDDNKLYVALLLRPSLKTIVDEVCFVDLSLSFSSSNTSGV